MYQRQTVVNEWWKNERMYETVERSEMMADFSRLYNAKIFSTAQTEPLLE